jgi:hypothetical protein
MEVEKEEEIGRLQAEQQAVEPKEEAQRSLALEEVLGIETQSKH